METVVPLCTPFTDDGLSVSEVRLARLVRWYRTKQQTRFFVLGECGEFSAVSPSERKSVVENVAREASGAEFIVNVTALSTSTAVDLAQHAARHGAAAVVTMPPFYPKLDDEETTSFIHAIASYAKQPVIVCDPRRSLTEAVKARLAEIPRLVVAVNRQGSLDDFVAGNWTSSTDVAVLPDRTVRGLTEFLTFSPKAKTVKAALDAQGLDCGTPRPPQKRLQGEPLTTLKHLLEPPLNTRLPA
ncbi:MAG TPA: dihydrodipicolinate synthase family protein [Fimbriimonadaceae bacterium]|nr:dihydrodipicolinate synthase family protein [Fimbriimonadaceae bacterium]